MISTVIPRDIDDVYVARLAGLEEQFTDFLADQQNAIRHALYINEYVESLLRRIESLEDENKTMRKKIVHANRAIADAVHNTENKFLKQQGQINRLNEAVALLTDGIRNLYI